MAKIVSWFPGFLILLASCSSVPRTAPRFVAPSTAPIAQAHKSAITHVDRAREITRSLHIELPADQQNVDSLLKELDETQAALNEAEGARIQLETQLKTQTAACNKLADNYDKAATQIETLKQSRHHWVKLFWYSAIGLLLAVAWIFHKPLMLAAGLPPL